MSGADRLAISGRVMDERARTGFWPPEATPTECRIFDILAEEGPSTDDEVIAILEEQDRREQAS